VVVVVVATVVVVLGGASVALDAVVGVAELVLDAAGVAAAPQPAARTSETATVPRRIPRTDGARFMSVSRQREDRERRGQPRPQGRAMLSSWSGSS